MAIRRRESGLTTVELLAPVGVLMVLVTIAIPLKRWDEKRRRENELRMALGVMREAIDRYKSEVDEGLIQQKDVDQRGVPGALGERGEGVGAGEPQSGQTHKVRFLSKVPTDPFTGKDEW